MKAKLTLLVLLVILFSARAEEVRFFRILGPVPSTITAFSKDGFVSWTNLLTNTTFTVQTAASLNGSNNWVDYTKVPVTNSVTTHRLYDPNPPVGMVLIPAGSFIMGNCMAANEGPTSELPLHTVYVSEVYMDKFEVTKALWDEVYQWATNHGYSFTHSGSGKAANHPASNMNWYDKVKWCNARSQKEGLNACYYTDASQATLYATGQLDLTNACVKWDANGYRLPTEAEWEKAARGGVSGRRFSWSDTDNITHSRANYYVFQSSGTNLYAYDSSLTAGFHPAFSAGSPPYSSPVGYFAPNGYGLYDMVGNAWEQVWDADSSIWYANPAASESNTRGPNGFSGRRLYRGGVWNFGADIARVSSRVNSDPNDYIANVGFRCVRGT